MAFFNLCLGTGFRRILLGVAMTAGATTLGWSADFSDPTWPCIQRKVDRLSVGLMWPHPIGKPEAFPAQVQREAADLAGYFALRRLSLQEIEPALKLFVAENNANPSLLGYVFELAFNRIASQRRTILAGIKTFSLKQAALAERIKAGRAEMERLLRADFPDYDGIDAIEARLDWDERIYTDRRKSLSYVCETPILLEKRLYAVARMIAQERPAQSLTR